MLKKYQICRKCIMDTTDLEITFDESGVCNHCKMYEKYEKEIVFKGKEGESRLKTIIDEIKKQGKNEQYDCVLGVSGGIDSSYVAFVAKTMGLRPLAVHLDNGWDSQLAVNNIEKILKKLDIDLYTYVINWEEFKDLQLSFLKASVANSEIPTDHAIVATIYKIAAEKNIKNVISGYNFVTEAILPTSWGYESQDLGHLNAIHKKFGKVTLKSFPKISFFDNVIYYQHVKKIKSSRILNYVDYNKEKAVNLLREKFDWSDYGGKHYESIYTRFFQGYILPKKFNIDKRRAHLSTLINSGQITRNNALDIISENPYQEKQLKEDMDYVIKKLGLNKKEFDEIMQLPVKKFNDYYSNHQLYTMFALYCQAKKRLVSAVKRIA